LLEITSKVENITNRPPTGTFNNLILYYCIIIMWCIFFNRIYLLIWIWLDH